MVGYRAFANCTAVLPDPSPSGFRPRIGVRDRLESSRIEGEEKILPARVPALALTPTLSQRERENWLLSLPVPLAEVGVSAWPRRPWIPACGEITTTKGFSRTWQEISIPDRSPGHAFIGIAHAGWCRHSQGMKSRSCGLVQRIDTVGSPTPRPDPCVGQAHALQDSGCRRNDGSRPFP